jgi:hypothetical protein
MNGNRNLNGERVTAQKGNLILRNEEKERGDERKVLL